MVQLEEGPVAPQDEDTVTSSSENSGNLQTTEISIENACEEYKQSVRITLCLINQKLGESLNRTWDALDELYEKISARTRFLENNPTFLACLPKVTQDSYRRQHQEPLSEFDELKIDLKQESLRIFDKIEETRKMHDKLFELVTMRGDDNDDDDVTTTTTTEDVVIGDATKEKPDTANNAELQEPVVATLQSGNTVQIRAPKNDGDSDVSESRAELSLIYSPLKFQYFPDLKADVWRGRNFQDLHQRLMQQLEVADSLEGFLTHMNRKPSPPKQPGHKIRPKKTRKLKNEILEEKYTGSLWFFHNKKITSCSQTSHRGPTSGCSGQGNKSSCTCSLLITTSHSPYITNQDKTRKARHELQRHTLKCYDLLDDVDKKDLKPIASEYPRKDNIFSNHDLALYQHGRQYKTYLHRMLEDQNLQNMWQTLLQPPKQQKILKSRLKISSANQNPNNNRITTKRKSLVGEENADGLVDFLTEKKRDFLVRQNMVCMPVRVIYDKNTTKKPVIPKNEGENTLREQQQKPALPTEKSSLKTRPKSARPPKNTNHTFMGEDVATLMEFLTQKSRDFFVGPKEVICMPVRVIYDKYPTRDDSPATNSGKIFKGYFDLSKASLTPTSSMSPRSQISTPRTPVTSLYNNTSSCSSPRQRIPEGEESASPRSDVSSIYKREIQERRSMLSHLRELKTKNDSIQKNIQKAIDVIETKMIDILSAKQSPDSEAFNEMEREISKVLKMMNEPVTAAESATSNTKSKPEKIEAEKDENCRHNPTVRLKKGVTIIKPVAPNFVPGVDLTHAKHHQSPRTILKPEENTKTLLRPENDNNPEMPAKRILVQERNGKLFTMEKKKAANIEEGERLLGQVDNVIKKIDSIYSKFYSEKTNIMATKNPPSKKDKEKENTFNNVIEFFDGLKQIMEMPPMEVFYKKTENIAQKFQQAKIFNQTAVYYEARLLGPSGDSVKKHERENGVVAHVEVENFSFAKEFFDLDNDPARSGSILSAFYSLFFSGIFVALNFDFTC